MGQEQERVTAREQQHATEEMLTKSSVNQQAAKEMDILDAVLDDIEDVLQNNAEEYVNSFVQKGGE